MLPLENKQENNEIATATIEMIKLITARRVAVVPCFLVWK